MKTLGGFNRSRYRGVERTGLYGYLVATAYNLVRMSMLIAEGEAKVPIVTQPSRGEVCLCDAKRRAIMAVSAVYRGPKRPREKNVTQRASQLHVPPTILPPAANPISVSQQLSPDVPGYLVNFLSDAGL